MLLDISMITVYLTLDRNMTPDGVGQLAEKIKNLDSKLFIYTIHSTFYS
jgi:hypothetical protein